MPRTLLLLTLPLACLILMLAAAITTAQPTAPNPAPKTAPNPASHPAQGRPNILLCIADDWGNHDASAYGDPAVATPAFDRLAREGVRFDQAFVSSPSCTPSRNALLTGQAFYRLGQGANLQSTLDVRHPNFVSILQAAGYRVGHDRKVWGPGVFEAGGYTQHPGGPPTPFAEFLRKLDPQQPFCFLLGTSDPHRPYDPGSGLRAGIDPAKIAVPPFLPDNPTVRSDLADYYFEVQRFDRDVANALARLEQAGLLDNTLIVMTGDNGMPFPRAKGNLYDAGARVPLAIRWGRHIPRPGRPTAAFVSLTDLAPTFLEAAGLPVPPEMTGRSLLPLLAGQLSDAAGPTPAQDRTFVITGRERHAAAQAMPSLVGYPSRAIRTADHLYILNLAPDRWPAGVPEGATHPIGRFPDCDDGPAKAFLLDHRDEPDIRPLFDLCFARRPAEELYDLRTDPHQLHNLAADPAHQQVKQSLHQQLVAELRRTADPRFTDGAEVQFDTYPYRDDRIHRRIREWQDRQPR